MSQVGMIIYLILMIVAVIVFLLILKAINKFVFKGSRKIDIIEVAIGWSAIFIINLICVLANSPFAIGIPYSPYLDAGVTKQYVSLGYIIETYKNTFDGTSAPRTTKFYFPGL